MVSLPSCTNYIFRYIRNNRRERIGLVAAFKLPNLSVDENCDNGTQAPVVIMGWALCNKRDKFDRDRGLKLAFERSKSRALKGKAIYGVRDPSRIHGDYRTFTGRAKSYFKDAELVS